MHSPIASQAALPVESSFASGLTADGEPTSGDAALSAVRTLCPSPPAAAAVDGSALSSSAGAGRAAAKAAADCGGGGGGGGVLSEPDRLRLTLLYLVHRWAHSGNPFLNKLGARARARAGGACLAGSWTRC